MCGFVGFLDSSNLLEQDARAQLIRMCDRLIHRGPDSSGEWIDSAAGIALGHRRLSILDLSSAGNQPMISASGRHVIVFNGEIYNHRDIRLKLQSVGISKWRSSSDTETILAAVDVWGLEKTLKELRGMFALALWDRKHRSLSLARDRMGEKPLYYGWHNGLLFFGSELKALRTHPSFNSEINIDALPLYLRHGYIPAPWTIYKDIRKLPPGTFVTLNRSSAHETPRQPEPYWSLPNLIKEAKLAPFTGTINEATDLLELHIRQAVTSQLLSDVPVGAFLSGGIDSSTVVALMQSESSVPIKTFTIGFDEANYNEAHYAKSIANYLGTDHSELYVTSTQAQDVIPKLPLIYDEPFGDSSAIPTYLVSALARNNVSVALSGDGGDELFAGYSRYFNQKLESLWHSGVCMPPWLLPAAKSVLRSNIPHLLDRINNPIKRFTGKGYSSSFASIAELAADLLECKTHESYYQRIISQWYPAPLQLETHPLQYGFPAEELAKIPHLIERMMAQDTLTYLPDDILAKVDRAAMSVSLETRVPLLDHRLVQFAWSLPFHFKVCNGNSKFLLKRVLRKYIPQNLIDRPKMGFGVPIDSWIRGPLRDWAEYLLAPKRLQESGYFDSNLVIARWNAHLDYSHNWRDSLWLILMWQSWFESISNE
jgi:asparagine synthase (glutamine-hydrolysing)